jgi:protein-S-isoprenylcysteine O-methyltransferase Ste14
MAEAVTTPHRIVAAIVCVFLVVGGYYRLQSQRSGERLDRSKEGWALFAALRLTGLLTVASAAAAAWVPRPESPALQWVGVIGFGFSVAWLLWMFRTLGRNLTDTVVVRKDAHLVEKGPYRYVRNPMYTGVLAAGISIGLALGTWLTPLGAVAMFILFAIRTRTEEKYLIERFGDSYRDYMRRVGRFFPKPNL